MIGLREKRRARTGPRTTSCDSGLDTTEPDPGDEDLGPKLAEEHDLAYWHADAVAKGHLAPQPKLADENETPITVNYDELVKSWAAAAK